jgi:16S rRNA (cytidine1402-2'-O)-methyltransferase
MDNATLASSTCKLFLIPNTLGETPIDQSLPAYASHVVASLQYFLVEDEKSARKLIKQLAPQLSIRELSIQRLNEHTKPEELSQLTAPLREGHSVGIISEAGCPAIADPGANVVKVAHELGMQVVPLVGPCSMVLALMASGLNGQSWRFQGYLPIENDKRIETIRSLDERVRTLGETQIMMDTPYRNEKLLQDLLAYCKSTTRLCIAQGLTTSNESIRTKSVHEWRQSAPSVEKIPALFLIGF